jgi:hypothetical protein
MNREVNLTKKVETAHGWRYGRVVLATNGRIKPDLVVVNGKQKCHKEKRVLPGVARRLEMGARG